MAAPAFFGIPGRAGLVCLGSAVDVSRAKQPDTSTGFRACAAQPLGAHGVHLGGLYIKPAGFPRRLLVLAEPDDIHVVLSIDRGAPGPRAHITVGLPAGVVFWRST